MAKLEAELRLHQAVRALMVEAKAEERARIKKILDQEMAGSSLVQDFLDKYEEVLHA